MSNSYINFWGSEPEDMPEFVLNQVKDIHLFKESNMRFGDVLVHRKYASRENIEMWVSKVPPNTRFGEYLLSLDPSVVGRGLKDALLPAIAATMTDPMLYISREDFEDVGLASVFSDNSIREECDQYRCLPILIGKSKFLAFSSFEDITRWKSLGPKETRLSLLNKNFMDNAAICLSDPANISEQAVKFSKERDRANAQNRVWKETELENSGEEEQHWINRVMNYVIKEAASDIHISPENDGQSVNVELRIDTMLQACPNHLNLTVQLYHKVKQFLVNKSSATKDNSPVYVPTDGEAIDYIPKSGGRRRLRLSFVPLGDGGIDVEKNLVRIVARCHPLDGIVSSLDQLHFVSDKAVDSLREMVTNRRGLIVMAGPMGCGKTTTMYALLKAMVEHYKGGRCIASIEDPIERELKGVRQTEISKHAREQGLGYRDYLKVFVRQDTNILYLGEVRDEDTANNAGQFASIGNCVLTTVHAESEEQAIVRLSSLITRRQDWQLIVSNLRYVMTQRLVPCLCSTCKVKVEFNDHRKERVKYLLTDYGHTYDNYKHQLDLVKSVYEVGTNECPACKGTGYQKIVPVIGILRIDEQLRDVLLDEAESRKVVREIVLTKRVTTMTEQVVKLVCDGVAPIEALNHG